MDKDLEIKNLKQKITELENKINSLFNSNGFPIEIENILVKRGFLKCQDNINFKITSLSQEGDNSMIVKFLEKTTLFDIPYKPVVFYVNTADNICISENHGIKEGGIVVFRTTDTLPAGLDDALDFYRALNVTNNTFQVALGSNPNVAVDITSSGSGVQYAIAYSSYNNTP